MKVRKRSKAIVAIVLSWVVISALLPTVIPGCNPTMVMLGIPFLGDILGARASRVRLLSETDHEALLDAGRKLLAQVPRRVDPQGRRIIGVFSVPGGTEIPKAIRDLGPRSVDVTYDGYLILEMHGGMDHFGFYIYPDDFRAPRPNFYYGDRELLEGLWYYDDGYEGHPSYGKRIDALIEKNKAAQGPTTH